jgi:hypothetical protein
VASISGVRSTPSTLPAGPTAPRRCGSARPVPQPTSRAVCPARRPRSATAAAYARSSSGKRCSQLLARGAKNAVGDGRGDAADDRPGGVVVLDDDVGGALGVDLGQVAGDGTGAVGVGARLDGLAQVDHQVPGRPAPGELEEAAVDDDHVVAGSSPTSTVAAERLQRRPPAAAAACGDRGGEVVGDAGTGRRDQGVHRDVDGPVAAEGPDGVGERADDPRAPGGSVGFGCGVHHGVIVAVAPSRTRTRRCGAFTSRTVRMPTIML